MPPYCWIPRPFTCDFSDAAMAAMSLTLPHAPASFHLHFNGDSESEAVMFYPTESRFRQSPRAAAWLALPLLLLLTTLVARSQSERIRMPASAPAAKWIDAWGVSFLSTTVNGAVQNVPTFNNQTIRFNVFPNLAGTEARVKFTNKFSKDPIQIGAAHIAIRGTGNA